MDGAAPGGGVCAKQDAERRPEGAALTYRHRTVTRDDVAFIRALIAHERAEDPAVSRRALSKKLCAAWNWVQQNGAPRDMVCRGLMLALHRAGEIELPPVRHVPCNPLASRAKPSEVDIDERPMADELGEVGPIEFRQVRRTAQEGLFNWLIESHHYLGYTQPVGEHLKFLVYAKGRPVACFAWSSAPRHLGPRDRFIGWPTDARLRNIRYVAYNTRFLILPWVKVRHLASHLLARMTKMLSAEWEKVYGHPVHFAETFVDTTRFRGSCYRAANWIWVGRTAGRGVRARTKRPNRTLKDILCYPLTGKFRELLLEQR